MPRYIDAEKIEYAHIVHDMGGLAFLDDFEEYIDCMPEEDVSPAVHAHWVPDPIYHKISGELGIDLNDTALLKHYRCSRCRRREACLSSKNPCEDMPFCHCGAKMDEEAKQ